MYKKLTDKEKEANKLYKDYSIERIIRSQKLNLTMIQYTLQSNELYDKNELYNLVQEAIMANLVLNKKLINDKK